MLRLLSLSILGWVLLAALGCGGGGDDTDPSSTPTPIPVSSTPQPTRPPGTPREGEIDLAVHSPTTTIWGSDSGDYFNDLPLLTAADVNGDGKDDILLGARFGDGPDNSRQDSGEVYLIYGKDPLPESVDLASGEAEVTIFGAAPNDQIGYAGAFADVNDDGRPDLILGAPFADSGVGAVYVIFGGADLPPIIDLSESTPDLTLRGPHTTSFFGDAIASTDANGDGVADILVGATFARRPADLISPGAQAGATYVFFGGPSIPSERDTAAGDFDVVIYGENADPHPDELGDNVFGADLNGDGFGDLIMTAEAADGPGNERSVAAEVHVVYGSADIGGVIDIATGDQDVYAFGADPNDTLGFGLSAGDVNNDGVDDLLASARGADGPNNSLSEAGEVHIFHGGDLPSTIDLLNDESDAYVYGSSNADMLGYSIIVLDLDGDGRNELLLGTGFADSPGDRREAGAVYIIDASTLSGPTSIENAPLILTIFGAQSDDQLGTATTFGDLDGDGSIEIITLALRGDGPDDSRPDAGEVYVIKP